MKKVNDIFDFRDYVFFLKDKLDTTNLSEVVGVHGDYGAGKTTTMNLLKEMYENDKTNINNVLEFSAWRNYYDDKDSVWKALLYELAGRIYEIFSELDENKITINGFNDGDNKKIRNKIKEEIEKPFYKKEIKSFTHLWNILKFKKNQEEIENQEERIILEYIKYLCLEVQYNLYQDLKDFKNREKLEKKESEINKHCLIAVLKSINQVLKGENIFSLLEKEEQSLLKPQIDSIEVIQRKFDILLEFYNLLRSENEEKIKIPPLIIMVDDLDRILPEKSVEILEILRIFFEKSEKIHFICAIDIRVIEKGIERKFNEKGNVKEDISRIEFEEYLEKIITLPFDLPAIPSVNLGEMKGVESLFGEEDEEDKENELRAFYNKIEKLKNALISKKLDTFSDFDSVIEKAKKEKTLLNSKKVLFDFISKDDFLMDQIKNAKSDSEFKDIIKTGLQANPRKIKRFLNVFELYFKIYLFRGIIDNDGKYNVQDSYIKDAQLLAKMLIIKLEWDEIYREFVKDKFFIVILEQISKKITGEIKKNNGKDTEKNGDINEITYKIDDKYIKSSKKYKLYSLLAMLLIGKNLEEKEKLGWTFEKVMVNIYKIYYLLPNIDSSMIENNENLGNISDFKLLQYVSEQDSNKIIFLKKYADLQLKNEEGIFDLYINLLSNDEKNERK